MSEGSVGLLVLAVLVVGNGIVAHRLIKNFWLASLLAAFDAAVMFQVAAFAYAGSLDPFFIIAFVVSFVFGLLGAFAIGFVMRRLGYAARSQQT